MSKQNSRSYFWTFAHHKQVDRRARLQSPWFQQQINTRLNEQSPCAPSSYIWPYFASSFVGAFFNKNWNNYLWICVSEQATASKRWSNHRLVKFCNQNVRTACIRLHASTTHMRMTKRENRAFKSARTILAHVVVHYYQRYRYFCWVEPGRDGSDFLDFCEAIIKARF